MDWIANDRNQPWWDMQWLMHDHVMHTPVISGWNGQTAFSYGHATNTPQVYSDHYPSPSTVAWANSVPPFPGFPPRMP